jgi:prepilin-type N-terminal cleavage/methylation domain-containing protein
MSSTETRSQKGYTLIELLVAMIFIVILASIGIFMYINFRKNQTIEEAIEATRIALLEAQSEAVENKTPYTVLFQNNAGKAQYSIFKQGKSPTEWDNVSEDSSVLISNLEVTFDPKGNTNKKEKKVIFTLDNKKKCLIFETFLKKIIKAEGAECN